MSHTKLFALILAILIFFEPQAFAQTQVFTKGDLDCGKWVNARNANQATILELNVLGFINGFAVARELDIWRTGDNPISVDQAQVMIDKYCKENPLSSPYDGVIKLFSEIFPEKVAPG